MARYLIVSTSGNPASRSRKMGRIAFSALEVAKVDCSWLDLTELNLPLCDGGACYGVPGAQKLNRAIEAADGILVAAPVYNYDVSASAKNMIELTGSAWKDKVVGFLCAAGGMNSYMSVMAYANSLMLDFRCVIIPRFVFATGNAFSEEAITDPEVTQRIKQVAAELVRFTEALRG
ncbi:MAG TPA: NAD(P)H-dependent oxidoreductase [Chthoniobacterales bacterium]